MQAVFDVIIVGAGVSAYSAAMYSARYKLKTLLIGENIGGTITLTDEVSNYPGFAKITGQELADKIRKHAQSYDIASIQDKVLKIERNSTGFKVSTKDASYNSKAIIYATGSEWRKLNIPGEKEFTNKGVHYCALCDGQLYKNKTIAVIGGADSAAKEALILSEHAKKVYIIYRREKIRAEPLTYEKVSSKNNIIIINNTNITEIKGDKFVNLVILDKPYKNSKTFKLDAVFVDIGHEPVSSLAKEVGVKLNDKKEIITDKNSKTNIKGFFAAGDVTDSEFKQAIIGAAQGVSAAYSAYNYLNEL